MDLSRMIRRFGLVVFLAALAGGVPSYGQTAGITGKATLQDGTLCVGCQVLIERQEVKGTYKTKTDKHGKYVYIGLPIGTYKLTLQDPNGRVLFFFGNKRLSLGDPTEVDFDLPKEVATAKKEQEANPEVQKKLEEQAKEQKEYTGLKGLFDQGVALLDQKKYGEAAAVFEKALPLAKGKNEVAILGRLASAYGGAASAETDRDARAKDREKAIEYFQKAIQANPSDANLHNNLGNIYADSGKIEEAKAEFEKAAQLDPAGASRYYFNLGAVLNNSGKMDEAASAFKKATESDAKYADAYFLLAQALMGKATMSPDGKVIPAPGTVEALKSYLNIEPQGKYAAAAQQMLQSIEGGVETEYSKKKKR